MSRVLSNQLVSEDSHPSKQRNPKIIPVLWIVQVLLALLFLFAGSMKLIMPIAMMTAQMPIPLPGLFLRFIGIAEIAGGLGLLLPGLLRIRRGLTPLAACGLIIIMIGATLITLLSDGITPALFPLIVGLLAVFVAYGRWPHFTADPLLGRLFH
jgi:uncharacterized membrane protein YphA (DoxX/SURF4 family)